MKPLAEALPPIARMQPPKEPISATLPTLSPGSTNVDGSPITPKRARAMDVRAFEPPTGQTSLSPLPTKHSQIWGLPLSKDDHGQREIALLLVQCFNVLDTYGRTPAQLKDTVALFLELLQDYPLPMIRDAFKKYAKSSREVPKPVDIIELMEAESTLIDHVRYLKAGGRLTPFGMQVIVAKLGEGWKTYVGN